MIEELDKTRAIPDEWIIIPPVPPTDPEKDPLRFCGIHKIGREIHRISGIALFVIFPYNYVAEQGYGAPGDLCMVWLQTGFTPEDKLYQIGWISEEILEFRLWGMPETLSMPPAQIFQWNVEVTS